MCLLQTLSHPSLTQSLPCWTAEWHGNRCFWQCCSCVGTQIALLCAGGERISASRVILAPGHSSRALLATLQDAGVKLVPKPFALGKFTLKIIFSRVTKCWHLVVVCMRDQLTMLTQGSGQSRLHA